MMPLERYALRGEATLQRLASGKQNARLVGTRALELDAFQGQTLSNYTNISSSHTALRLL